MSTSNGPRLGLISQLDNASVYPRRHSEREVQLAETILENKNVDENFDSPIVVSAANKSTGVLLDATLAAGDEFAFSTRKNMFEAHVQSVNGTVVNTFPFVSADGLEVNVDDNATDGVLGWEISNGILTNSHAAFTVGTDERFFFEVTLKIDDISDVTELAMGFRKAEAYQANIDDYDEMATLNIDTDTNLLIETILNGATTSTVNTTQDATEGSNITLRVEVNKNRFVKFLIDGSAPTVDVTDFQFDNGEVVVPFLFLIAETGDPGVSISSWRAGKY